MDLLNLLVHGEPYKIEAAILYAAIAQGFTFVGYRDWQKTPDAWGSELILGDVPSPTIYGTDDNAGFLIKSGTRKMEVRVAYERDIRGATFADELPYIYLNCLETFTEHEIVIVVQDFDEWVGAGGCQMAQGGGGGEEIREERFAAEEHPGCDSRRVRRLGQGSLPPSAPLIPGAPCRASRCGAFKPRATRRQTSHRHSENLP